mmetsp:Transcript_23908/g.67018  ORF Transcript_23908/g.67018 Transcript_23908/m.67018 type:complete len:335 (+) Transcript_23908:42-1046(+)
MDITTKRLRNWCKYRGSCKISMPSRSVVLALMCGLQQHPSGDCTDPLRIRRRVARCNLSATARIRDEEGDDCRHEKGSGGSAVAVLLVNVEVQHAHAQDARDRNQWREHTEHRIVGSCGEEREVVRSRVQARLYGDAGLCKLLRISLGGEDQCGTFRLRRSVGCTVYTLCLDSRFEEASRPPCSGILSKCTDDEVDGDDVVAARCHDQQRVRAAEAAESADRTATKLEGRRQHGRGAGARRLAEYPKADLIRHRQLLEAGANRCEDAEAVDDLGRVIGRGERFRQLRCCHREALCGESLAHAHAIEARAQEAVRKEHDAIRRLHLPNFSSGTVR